MLLAPLPSSTGSPRGGGAAGSAGQKDKAAEFQSPAHKKGRTGGQSDEEGDKDKSEKGKGKDTDKGSKRTGGGGKKDQAKETFKKGVPTAGKEQLALLTKGVLRCLQDSRTTSGVLFDVLVLAASSPIIDLMQQQGQLYNETVQLDKNHKQGPPHIWVMGGLIQGLLQQGQAVGARTAEVLKEFSEDYTVWTIEERADKIAHCRVEKMFVADSRKITLAINRLGPVREAILQGLVQSGAVRKLGRAPRGALERNLEDMLKAIVV